MTKTYTIPATILTELQLQVNENGATPIAMTHVVLRLKKAVDAVLNACDDMDKLVTHGDNYPANSKVVSTPAHRERLARVQLMGDRRSVDGIRQFAQAVSEWAYEQAKLTAQIDDGEG